MNSHRIYVASSWQNKHQPSIVKMLREAGHQVYDFRNPAPGKNGFHWDTIDPNWENWTARDFTQALRHPLAVTGYWQDYEALQQANVVILLLPSGRSAHCEAGYFKGRGGVVIVHSPGPCEPELMYKFFNAITTDSAELRDALTLDIISLGRLRLATADPALRPGSAHTLRPIDRNTPEWIDAWNALERAGHSRDDYMLMFAEGNVVAFKHRVTRTYIHVNLPAKGEQHVGS